MVMGCIAIPYIQSRYRSRHRENQKEDRCNRLIDREYAPQGIDGMNVPEADRRHRHDGIINAIQQGCISLVENVEVAIKDLVEETEDEDDVDEGKAKRDQVPPRPDLMGVLFLQVGGIEENGHEVQAHDLKYANISQNTP